MLQRSFSVEEEYLQRQKFSQQELQQTQQKLVPLQPPRPVVIQIGASDFSSSGVDAKHRAAGEPEHAEFLDHGTSGAAAQHGPHQSMLFQQLHNGQFQTITTMNVRTAATSETPIPPVTTTLYRNILASQQQPAQLACEYAYSASSVEKLAIQHRHAYPPTLNQPAERDVVDKNMAMWVGNIPVDATEQELLFYFASSNPISIYLRPGSRCAFVNYRTYSEVDRAVELYNRSNLRLCQIVCRKRRPSMKGPEHSQRITTVSNAPENMIGGPRYFLALCQDRAVFDVIQSEQKYIPTASAIIKLQSAIQLGTPVFVVFVTECDHCIRSIARVIPPLREGVWKQKYIQLRIERTGTLPLHQVFDPAVAMTIGRMLDGQEFGLDLASRVTGAFRIMQIYNAGGSSATVSRSSSLEELPSTAYPGDERHFEAGGGERVLPDASSTITDGVDIVHRSEHVSRLKTSGVSAPTEKFQTSGAMEYHPLQSQSLFDLQNFLASDVQRPASPDRPFGQRRMPKTSSMAAGTAGPLHGTRMPDLEEVKHDTAVPSTSVDSPEILFVPTARDEWIGHRENTPSGNPSWDLSKTRRAKYSRS